MANNWIELNGKKEPPFDKRMIVLLQGTNAWAEVFLKKKEETSEGKSYIFHKPDDYDYEIYTATHYMIPEPPKISIKVTG